jgi:hypothetical protein
VIQRTRPRGGTTIGRPGRGTSKGPTRLLEARTLTPSPKGAPSWSHGYVYPLVSAFLLARDRDVLGLEVGDVGSDRGIVTFRPNAWRRPYADRRVVERGGTSLFSETGVRLTDWRKLLDGVAVQPGWPARSAASGSALGQGSAAMIEKAYSDLGAFRHRSDVVEYRAEQHATKLGDRLTAVRGGETLPRTLPDPAAPAG